MKKQISFFIAAACAAVFSVNGQQLKTPQPSPTQTLKQNFALSDITLEYSRPGIKGRVVYGDLVPWGKVWRTGANSSTKITFGEDVKVEGRAVAKGTYAIYTIPNKDSWDIMLYKDLDLGGSVEKYKTENELLRFKVKPTAYPAKIETFTMNFANMTTTSAEVELLWDQTRVAFNVTSDIDPTIMKNIETAMANDSRPYFQAANYYYENGKDLNKALEWVNVAIAQYPKRYWQIHLKAKIQMKQGDYKGAIATAQQSMAVAKEEGAEDYIRLNEKLIAEASAKK